jgi:putative ABC transport system permease protein
MWRSTRRHSDVERDIRDHIELATEENIAEGMSPEEARRQARLEFGNVAATIEDTRAVWTAVWVSQFAQDLRYGLRLVSRQPAFGIVVTLTLALGIGMNSAVFSVANAVLLRPLSYPAPERLVWFGLRDAFGVGTEAVLSTDFAVWREQATSFDLMVAYDPITSYSLVARDTASQTRAASVTHDFWALSGARLVLGRLPHVGERGVVVLSDAFFTERFQRDPAVVGSAVTINGQQVTILGVLPADFRFELPGESIIDKTLQGHSIDVYRAMVLAPQERGRGRGQILYAVGRLKSDVSIDRARTELEAIRARIVQTSPLPSLDRNVLSVAPLHERLIGEARQALRILLAAVGFVLLIACTNIASLLLARSSARQKETAIRASLGASRGRLLRQSMAESTVLAFAGGAAGLLLAYWGLAAIVRLTPQAVPRLAESRIDGWVIGFSLMTSVLTACLFSLEPAVSQWRANLLAVLRSGGQSASLPPDHVRTRRVLVATELALAVVLLTGAGLMIKSFWRMHEHPPGFEPERILSFTVPLSGPRYRDIAQRRRFADEVVGRMQSAHIDAFGLSTGSDQIMIVRKEGAPAPRPDQPRPGASFNATSSGYAKAMGLRLLSGRWITDDEPEPVFVINERLARRDFRGEDPVGKRIQIPILQEPGAKPSFATIVGVVSDVKYSKLDAEPGAELYIPYRHHPGLFRFTVLVRLAGDPRSAIPGFRRMLADIDPTQPMFDVTTLEQALAESITPRRFNLILLGTFAAAAVMLAMIGIYGVIAYIVTLRTHEIGVRMALGAERRAVVRMVLQQGLGMTFAGLVMGIVAALGLTRFMASLLYDVEPTDPATFTLVAVMLAIAALAACGASALEAARVDPLVSLRYE